MLRCPINFNPFHLFNPWTPLPPVTCRDETWLWPHFRRHNIRPKLASSILKVGKGKDLSNDTQIRVIDSMEPEIFTRMLRNVSEKLSAYWNFVGLHLATPW